MLHKSVIQHYYLGTEAQEILPYNRKRVSAIIFADGINTSATIIIGNTANQAENGPTVYGFYYSIPINGINSVWASADKNASTKQAITVVETIEE